MSREDLKERLKVEVAEWEAKTYAELAALTFPVVYEHGKAGEPDYYCTEVCLLESKAGYIHVSVAVDDGGGSAFAPVAEGVTVMASR